MNPLQLPKRHKGKLEEPPESTETVAPPFLGVKAAVSVRKGPGTITVEVVGLSSTPSGTYHLTFVKGADLGYYFGKLKLKGVARRAAVYDRGCPDKGRRRLTHIPEEGTTIVLGNPNYGQSVHLQRGSNDAETLARNMGRRGKEPPPKFVDFDMRYK